MGGFIRIAKTGDLTSGTMKKITVMGHDLLLARTGERYYCTDATCPHLGSDLSKGSLAGTTLTCPCIIPGSISQTGTLCSGPTSPAYG
jgi:nitrite reductase/ring-hydroxylating ferredoxin subunit